MTIRANITSEGFFIDGNKITVRLIKSSDKAPLDSFTDLLSDEAKSFHFFGGFHQLTQSELKLLCDEKSTESVGVVAIHSENGRPVDVGAARYFKNQFTGSHELAVTVSDVYKRTRLANELISFLVLYARRHGIKSLHMIDIDSNVDVRNLAEELKMSVRLDRNDPHKVIYSLNVDEHQGTVQF